MLLEAPTALGGRANVRSRRNHGRRGAGGRAREPRWEVLYPRAIRAAVPSVGVNYDHDSQGEGRLLEDYWIDEWETVRGDFREMKELGANVVRIHLQFGKPLLIEETFPLNCSLQKMDDFLKRSKARAEGYVSFYWGRTIEEYAAVTEKKEVAALMGAWLNYFREQADFMKQP